MGQTTTSTQVWTPDSTDLGHPDVYLATMSASIENGIGARLTKQELLQGLFANIPSGTSVPITGGTETVLAMTVNAGVGFNQGMTLAGGTVTITQAGLYSISAGVTTAQSTGYLDTKIYQNAGIVGRALTPATTVGGGFAFGNTSVSVTCAVGDTLNVRITAFTRTTPGGADTATTLLTGASTYNTLSVTLLKAM